MEFYLRNLKRFGLVLYSQRTYGQVETTARFTALKWSRDTASQKILMVVVDCCTGGEEVEAEFLLGEL